MAIEKTGSLDGAAKEPLSLQIEAAALSDIGRKRTNNEDSYGYDMRAKIFVVCDGMGGMAAGEVASSVAVHQTLQSYKDSLNQGVSVEESLQGAIVSANKAVWRIGEANNDLRGMGTTLVAACVHNNHIVIGNVGDSRAYFLRDGSCVQITEDHSYVAESTATPESIPFLQCYITRAVGVASEVTPDLFAAELEPGDTILLATDGLTRYIDTDEIAKQVVETQDLEELCGRFIRFAHEKGAADNVTCLILRAVSGE